MGNDLKEDVLHCSRSYDWSVLLTELRQLKMREMLFFAETERPETASPLYHGSLELHFHRYQGTIHECLLRREEMGRFETVLRVALCYVSFPATFLSSMDFLEWGRKIQMLVFDAWHIALLQLILDKDTVHAKSRRTAAQVLCNSITDCAETSARLMHLVSPAPSQSTIAHNIFSDHIQSEMDNDTVGTRNKESEARTVNTISWVDLLLASASHRPTLAVVVACLHNSLCALSSQNSPNVQMELVYPIADATLLISTLLRHVISTSAVLPPQTEDRATTTVVNVCDTTDDATEWIALTVAKLCRLGRLEQLYRSIHPGPLSISVLPEHVVLLHLVRNVIEEAPNHDDGMNTSGNRCFILGGEVDDDDIGPGIVETHRFLTSLYLTLHDVTVLPDSCEANLQPAAIQLVLDILAESLSEDSTVAATCRYVIGRETSFLPALVSDLAAILDAWYAANKTVFTRHQTKLNETDQCRITASVRVLGNLCYHCAHNQDLLRETVIPYSNPTPEMPDVEHFEASSLTNPIERNGLHVLLSTTSMSYACFTLREWAVVAIRAALEECPQNQAVVAALEAQSSVNSADLENMGIRVNLDATKGVVSVSQVDDDSKTRL